MLCLRRLAEERRLRDEKLLEIEGANVEDVVHGNFGLLTTHHRRELVHPPDALFDADQGLLVRYEVDLVDDDAVGEGELPLGFVDRALGLLFIEVLFDVLRVDAGDDPVEPVMLLAGVVHEESLSDRSRIGHSWHRTKRR